MATILPFRRAAPSPLAASVLEATVAEIRPAIWRQLRVAQSLTLRELHHVLQICLEGARAGPPDDCGGPGGYERLVKVLADKTHEDYKDMRRWAGARFDPEKLALASINRELQRAGTRAFRTSRERGYDGL